MFEELSPALPESSNLVNLAEGAMSAAAQVEGRAGRSKSFCSLSLFGESLSEQLVATKKGERWGKKEKL